MSNRFIKPIVIIGLILLLSLIFLMKIIVALPEKMPETVQANIDSAHVNSLRYYFSDFSPEEPINIAVAMTDDQLHDFVRLINKCDFRIINAQNQEEDYTGGALCYIAFYNNYLAPLCRLDYANDNTLLLDYKNYTYSCEVKDKELLEYLGYIDEFVAQASNRN